MKERTLTASPREGVGKGPARQTRLNSRIPGILYGPETEPQPIDLDGRELTLMMRSLGGSAAIFDLDVKGKKRKVIVRDMQRDPITSNIIHVDLHALSMTKPIHMSIPLHFLGTPKGVKTDGGIMQTNMREIEISCLPAKLPEFFEINVEDLGIGDSIHVSDLDLPDIDILSEAQRTIVVISAPTVVKEPVVEEEGEEGELAEGAEAPAEGEAGATADGAKPAEEKKDK